MNTLDAVRSEVLALTPSERASLAHDLILSLDQPAAYDLEADQEAEIQRRLARVHEGTATYRPAHEVVRGIG